MAAIVCTAVMAQVLIFGLKPDTAYYVFIDGTYQGLKPTWFPEEIIQLPGGGAVYTIIAHGDTVLTGVGDPARVPTSIVFRPNPFDNSLLVDVKRNEELIIYDAKGREVFGADLVRGTNRLELDLPNGVYFWKVGSASGKLVRVK